MDNWVGTVGRHLVRVVVRVVIFGTHQAAVLPDRGRSTLILSTR